MSGIGLDVVDLDRFRRLLSRRPAIAERVFTESERADAARAADPVPHLAARFAAKEAVMKALAVGIGAFGFGEVEVRRAKGGAPSVALSGRAAALAQSRGADVWHLSMTHSQLVAAASVVAVSSR